MKNPNDTMGNLTRDLPVSSAVLNQLLHSVPTHIHTTYLKSPFI